MKLQYKTTPITLKHRI